MVFPQSRWRQAPDLAVLAARARGAQSGGLLWPHLGSRSTAGSGALLPQHSLQGCARILLLSQLPAALLIAVLLHILQLSSAVHGVGSASAPW